MDTDDLSKETYKAVLIAAEKFHHDLTLQFGLLSYNCHTDDDFLNKAEALIKSWLSESDLQFVISDIFFERRPAETRFRHVLQSILHNISSVKEISPDKRKFDSW